MPKIQWIIEPESGMMPAGSLAPRYAICDVTFEPADTPAQIEHNLGAYSGLPCFSWAPLASSGFYVLPGGRHRPQPAPAPFFRAITDCMMEVDGCDPNNRVTIRLIMWRPELGAADS